MQPQFYFFGPHDLRGRPAPTDEVKRSKIDRMNPSSPFSKFIGNDKAVRKLQVAAFKALGDPGHMMRDLAFAIFGPASAGKTTIARLYADTVRLPFIEVSPKQLKNLDDLFNLTNTVLTESGLALVEISSNKYKLPPCVIFIDEVHALSDNVVQGLLKATEFNDCVMATEAGRVVNTHNVTWMIATTDEGKLFDAFRTRFSPVQLTYLTKLEIAKIVGLAHSDLSEDACRLVAHYNGRVPRKALEFARYMKMVKSMESNKSWEEVARQVASDEGVDEFGMSEVHLRVLKALANGPVASKRIPTITGRKEEEVEKYIMPYLLCSTEDQPSMVTTCSKGYTLTESGVEELLKRNLPYNRLRVV